MSRRNPICITLGITDSWAFAAGTVLLGLKRFTDMSRADVVIFHNGLSEANKKILNAVHPCRFETFTIRLKNPERFKRVSEMAFSRFECFGLLNQYPHVLWIDADALVRNDISEIFQLDSSGIAMYKHAGIPMRVSFRKDVPGYDMERECFNDGIFYFNEALRRKTDPDNLRAWCFEKTNEYSEYINSDQAVINLMLQHFNLEVTELDIKYNCPPDKETDDTVIVHPWGTKKFWKELHHPLWDEFLREWKSLGGDVGVRIVPPPGKLKMTYRKTRKKVKNIFKRVRSVFSNPDENA